MNLDIWYDKIVHWFKGNKVAHLIISATLAGLAIVFGTIASKLCPYPILAPLLFAVGILMCMAFDLDLITRYTPTAPKLNLWEWAAIFVINLGVAGIAGIFSPLTATPPDNLFLMSIAGGIVIGLVSQNNLFATPYKVALALMIMYCFIQLNIPHVVVYAFLGVDLPTLFIVAIGNLLGGLILRYSFKFLKDTKEK